MGACGSSDGLSNEERASRKAEKDRSKALESKMSQDHSADQQINKLLLLGAGESGKSTLFKQMITIYGKGFPEAERKTYTSIIFNNMLTSIKTLAQQSANYGPVASSVESSKRAVEECKGDEDIDKQLGAHIRALWKDSGIQATYQQRSLYQLTDSAAYFFDKVDEVCLGHSNYLCSGIVENDFVIDGNQFKMYDVGGQRNERKKWIHCEYDQVLYEDENTNRMVEALNLFEEICNSRWFRDTSMILFLNKRDLFGEKIKKVPLSVCFQDYVGPNTYDAGTAFIKDQFESKNRNPDKQVYSHITCATDTDNVAAVFNAVKDIIIRKSLNEAGLV